MRLTAAVVCVGVLGGVASGGPYDGWTLWTRGSSTLTNLVDMSGTVVKTWASAYTPAASVYLLENGAILRPAYDHSLPGPDGAGAGGRVQRIEWDGTVSWDYVAAGADFRQHHDIEPMPNGNVLVLIREAKTPGEAIAAGRDPANAGTEIWSEGLIEVQPTGPTSGVVVWEWHAWDHLVQDFDAGKPNFGDPSDFVGQIDVNYPVGSSQRSWLHVNAVEYNAKLDQIVLSCHEFNELWVISHKVGDSGELMYRWGNPEAYGMGTPADRRLYGQHDTQWIKDGLPGAGNMLILNNGVGRPGGNATTADEIVPPVNPDGTYFRGAGQPFGPTSLAWTSDKVDGSIIYSQLMSGAQRLANGNTLICLALSGKFIEVDTDGTSQWSYTPGPTQFRATRIGSRDARLQGTLWCLADITTQGAGVGDPGYLVPDGLVSASDLNLYVNEWIVGNKTVGDVTTTGVGAGEPGYLVPDGVVSAADIQVFVNLYVAGCF